MILPDGNDGHTTRSICSEWACPIKSSSQAANLAVPEDILVDLIRITAFNLEARYPDYKKKFRNKCTKQFTAQELDKIYEIFKWLQSTK